MKSQKKSFTMAEILISLTIIGIIAAITLPSLRANINEKAWATQRKALYSRMSQAIALMPYINGYGVGATQAETNNNAAMDFVSNGLAKVLKINSICDSTHLKDCGLPDSFKKFKSSGKTSFPTTLHGLNSNFSRGSDNPTKNMNTKVAAFETANGESIAVYYNPSCVSKDIVMNGIGVWDSELGEPKYVLPYMCADFVYDLNGRKGPNAVGKDIWYMTLMYSDKSELSHVEPLSLSKWGANSAEFNFQDAINYCASIGARLPNVEEGIANSVNNYLVGTAFGYLRDISDKIMGRAITYSGVLIKYGSTSLGVRCIYKSQKH